MIAILIGLLGVGHLVERLGATAAILVHLRVRTTVSALAQLTPGSMRTVAETHGRRS